MNEYNYLSYIYDKSMEISKVDYNKWLDKILYLMRDEKNNIQNILELGCGTGNISNKLLECGYEIVGIDISSQMLDISREKNMKYGNKLILLQQDLRDIDFDIYEIDMILASNDIINYITDKNDVINLFRFCYDHLKVDGILVFDISSMYKLQNILSNNTFYEDGGNYCMVWQNSYDNIKKLIEMDIDIFIKQDDGRYNRYQEFHRQRAYEENEIENILKKVGFTDIIKDFFYESKNNSDKIENAKNIERIFYSVKK